MLLSIEDYNRREQAALPCLANRAIEGFRPVTFLSQGYPMFVSQEAELARYVDTQHEVSERVDMFCAPDFVYSQDEAGLITTISDKVMSMTRKRYGRAIRPWIGPLVALPAFRAIVALARESGKKALRIFEVGPGSGYLGALLIASGYRYISFENTQAYYLWQNRLYDWLVPGEFMELAMPQVEALDISSRVVHVPWWEYCRFHERNPIEADIVVCDHALGELHPYALKYILRISHQMLDGPGMKIFLFTHPGLLRTPFPKLIREFRDAGFLQLMSGEVWAMTPAGSEWSKYTKDFVMDFFSPPPPRTTLGRIRRKFRSIRYQPRVPRPRPPIFDMERAIPLYNPSGNAETLRAYDFLTLHKNESPYDYGFISFIGYKTPEVKEPV
jgi:hypothetical protein